MKVLLISLNAKYIHTNLAIRYLEGYCKELEDTHIKVREFTINDHWDRILKEIYKEQADVIAFSCYIWNVEQTIKMVPLIKGVQPEAKIILGGPEVTFYGDKWMKKVEEIDYIVKGEGEVTLYELLKFLQSDLQIPNKVNGIIYRRNDEILETSNRQLMEHLDAIPFPYPEDLSDFKNKIIYYESSRGCPFHCQYCLSSTTEGVRYFPLDQVKKHLKFFIDAGVKQVKFVDRTFNCNKDRTMELLRFLIDQGGETNFHFEVAADLIDQEILELLEKASPGLFQLEIGIQSTHLPTLEAIQRKNDFPKIKEVVQRISSFQNIHQHVDLIAGLPYENYETFKKSFNDVYYLKADMLQMGFLKVLKGSGIEVDKEKYDYKYTSFPPYEVLSNKYLSYREVIKLKMIEDILEKYGNSHVFDYTIDYLLKDYYKTPFDFFEDLAQHWEKQNLFYASHSQKNLYKIFLDFWKSKEKDIKIFHEMLKFDYLLTHKAPLPKFFQINDIAQKKKRIFEFLQREENIEKYLPELIGLPPKEIYKYVQFENFSMDILASLNQKQTTKKNQENILLFHFLKGKKDISNKATVYDVEL